MDAGRRLREPGPTRVVHFVHALNGRTLADVAGVLAGQMVSSGCDVTVLAVRRTSEARALPAGVANEVLGDAGTWRTLGATRSLRRALRRGAPDIVFAHGNGPIRATVLATRAWRSRPVVIGIEHNHYSSYDWNLRRVRNAMNRTLLPRADVLVGVSAGVAEDLEQNFPRLAGRVAVIPPPLSRWADRHRLAREPVDHPWFAEDVPIIAAVGHVHARKDHRTLVRAMAHLRDVAGPVAARLVIIGSAEGAEAAAVRALIVELDLADMAVLIGEKANPLAYVARSTVFALSSRNEGMPVSILEAMSVGVPVVSTDCPSGPAWILENGAKGLLAPVGDARALGDALLRMLADDELRARLASWGPHRAADFSPSAIASRYLRVASGGRADGSVPTDTSA